MKFKNLVNNGGFCILPFIHQEKKFNGTYHICCYGDQLQSDNPADDSLASFNSSKMSLIRDDMIAGIKNNACRSCYQQEENNIYSPRMRENDTWVNWSDTHSAVENCFVDYFHNDTMKPISYDLRYSNTCTLKCRMCNSSSSSALNAEYKKIHNLWPEKFWITDNPRINHNIELHKDIKKIYLAGGEPLVEPYNLELLRKLIEENNEVNLLINTSLNIVSDKFLEILNQFKNLTLVVSIDGTEQVNDYIRYGSKFEIVKENIHKLYHHDIMFSTCVSIYNIFNLKNLVEFISIEFPKYSFNHGINIVNDIEELFIENLPYEYRNKVIIELEELEKNITASWPKQGIKNIVEILKKENFDQERFKKFIRYTKILDVERNQSVTEIIPELKDYFNE